MKHLPRSKFVGNLMLITLLLAVVFTVTPAAHAALPTPPIAGPYDATLTPHEIRSRLGLSENVEVATDSQLSSVIALCHRIGAYLVRQEDGTLALQLDDPGTVGVSRPFLNEYRNGLEQINALIRRGWITVDENLELQRGSQFPHSHDALDAGLAEIEGHTHDGHATTVLPAGESPERYGSGFSFSFHSRRHHLPYRYASLAPTFASYFGYGEYTARFGLLFALNENFFTRTFYYGGYFFYPWHNPRHIGHKHRFYYWPNQYGYFTGRWQTIFLYS
ncbi:MAG: hypothetical protein D6791_14110 [Chloroflexi bacterium]|nr:MAG: hypothetical protein D6791_14110 [Chloroflexota bacterium]